MGHTTITDYNAAISRAFGDPSEYAESFLAGAGPKTLCIPNLALNYDLLQQFIPMLTVNNTYIWSAWGPSVRKELKCTTM